MKEMMLKAMIFYRKKNRNKIHHFLWHTPMLYLALYSYISTRILRNFSCKRRGHVEIQVYFQEIRGKDYNKAPVVSYNFLQSMLRQYFVAHSKTREDSILKYRLCKYYDLMQGVRIHTTICKLFQPQTIWLFVWMY